MNRRNFLKLSGITCGATLISPLAFPQGHKKVFSNIDKVKNTSIELMKYLEENSLTHQVLFADYLPCGGMSYYKAHTNFVEIDATALFKYDGDDGDNTFKTGKECVMKEYSCEESFIAPTWFHSVEQITPYKFITESLDNTGENKVYTDTMPKPVFGSLKKKFLNQQEQLFMKLVKHATKKAGTYLKIPAKEEDHAFWLAIKQKYTTAWVGSKFKDNFLIKQMWNKSTVYSDNLNGILLTNEEDPIDNGAILLRQAPCILPSIKTGQYVAYEDISMFVIGKHLTYIEIE